MRSSGYVRIATEWLPTVLDSLEPADPDAMNLLEGVVAFRHHAPDTDLKNSFMSRLKNLKETTSFSSYALYAYDSFWLAARAFDAFLNAGGNASFSNATRLHDRNGSTLHLGSLCAFEGGPQFLQTMLIMNFPGLSGQIQFDMDKNLIYPAYDIINIGGFRSRRIGYWSNYSGLSVVAAETLYRKPANTSTSSQHLQSYVARRDHNNTKVWVFPNNRKPVRIAVPNRVSYKELIVEDENPPGV